jgi:hypothetical protein
VERCRSGGASGRSVLDSGFACGEDAEVVDAGEQGWRSHRELHDFVARPAAAEERDWRALDPRRHGEEEGP